MTSARVDQKPNYAEIADSIEREKIINEILKIKPQVEVSIEGHSELAKGRLIEWNAARKLFTVRWEKKSERFDEVTDARAGLRAFFKAQLFSTQLVFKTTAARRLADGNFHYRIPIQIFKQQRRGALRVPTAQANSIFICDQGKFKITDLSVGGARLKTKQAERLNFLSACELSLMGTRLKTPGFSAQVTYRDDEQIGVRFSGLNDKIKVQIKQFLIEALKMHYRQEW